MKIHEGLNQLPEFRNPIITSGTFDGVHVGHQAILKRIIVDAKEAQGESILLTFWPHPRMVLNKSAGDLKLLSTMAEKKDLLELTGIDHLVIIPFTKDFAKTTSEEFIREILVKKLGAKKLVIGYDHRFGNNREGSFEALKENGPSYGFQVEEISKQEVDEIAVSSTKIRTALLEGKVERAINWLGRPFEMNGTVVKGDGRGSQLGYPTANVNIPEAYKLIPGNGVYAVQVELEGQKLDGMMNIGTKPTFGVFEKQAEVHIFDFSADLYGKHLKVEFIQSIREERKFNGAEALMKQLAADKEIAISYLKRWKNDK